MEKLNFKTVIPFLVEAIPEFRDRVEPDKQKVGEYSPEAYSVMRLLTPIISRALDRGDDLEFLRRVFNAFEQLAACRDLGVINLLQVGFLENVITHTARLAAAWTFMGPATRKLATSTARIWGLEDNLPAGP